MKLINLALPTFCTIACGVAQAQSVLHTFYGPAAGSDAGHSVAGIGDVNNDGKDDLLVGIPYDATLGYHTGRATVYSGASGAILYNFVGLNGGDEFGWSVGAAGDVSNDGRPDFIVGARSGQLAGVHTGMARVYSGFDGSVLWTWYGDSNGDLFGSAVVGGYDADADGYADLLVGAPGDDNAGVDSGSARAFNGRTGVAFTTFNGTTGSNFGACVALVGDLTTDSAIDFAVGAPYAMNGASQAVGRALVFNGVTGAVAWSWYGVQVNEQFGCSIAGGLDVDLDGYSDVIVGAQANDFAGNNATGAATLFSGRTGGIFNTYHGAAANEQLGCSVAVLGDVNNDGSRDFALGADTQALAPGYVTVRSGTTGLEIYRFFGDSNLDHLGCSLANAGDVNNDGIDDIVFGAEYGDGAVLDTGLARVCSGKWLQPVVYCTAKVNSQGCTPAIYTGGVPSYSNLQQGFSILADHIINQRPGILIYGTQKATTPFYGGTLCVMNPITRTQLTNSNGSTIGTDCTGTLAINFHNVVQAHTDSRLTPGRVVYAQWWYRDGQSVGGSGLSNAVSFAIAP